MFQLKAKVNYYDCDERDRLKLSAAMRCAQQASSAHLESIGIPNRMLVEANTVFILLKSIIRVHRMPVASEEMVIGTAPVGVKGVRFLREFRFDTPEGEPLLSCLTLWVLLDPSQRKILRPKAFPHSLPLEESILDHPLEDLPLIKPEKMEPCFTVDIRYSYLDVNRHVNNSFYADFACDALDHDQLVSKDLEEAAIHFQNEAVWGEQITIQKGECTGGTHYIAGHHPDGTPCFEAQLKLKQ